MKKMRPRSVGTNKFRALAEKAISDRTPSAKEVSGDEVRRLIHELEVHQIELEMQNEELRRAQTELSRSQEE